MKAKSLLAAVLALFCTTLVSEASILVYKGTAKIVRGNSTRAKPVSTTLYFIIDVTTLQGVFVFAQNIAGTKTAFIDGSPLNYGLSNPIKTTGALSVYYAITSGNFTNANNFNFFQVRMGGKRANIFLKASDTTPANLGKTMTGSYSYIDGTPHVVDGTFTVTVSLKDTQTANANGLSVSSEAALIENDFVNNKGYSNTVPSP